MLKLLSLSLLSPWLVSGSLHYRYKFDNSFYLKRVSQLLTTILSFISETKKNCKLHVEMTGRSVNIDIGVLYSLKNHWIIICENGSIERKFLGKDHPITGTRFDKVVNLAWVAVR